MDTVSQSSLRYGKRTLFEEVNLNLYRKLLRHYSANGAGKYIYEDIIR